MTTKEQTVVDLWSAIDDRIDARVERHLRDFGANYRPRGASSLALVLGTPGVPTTASLVLPWMFVKVPYPVLARECHILADVVGSMTFDIKVQRPGQLVTDATSIVGGIYPALVAQQEVVIDPSLVGWPNQPTYIEPGSVVSVYVVDTDGSIGQVTLNLGGRVP